jgi:hypothetical protein
MSVPEDGDVAHSSTLILCLCLSMVCFNHLLVVRGHVQGGKRYSNNEVWPCNTCSPSQFAQCLTSCSPMQSDARLGLCLSLPIPRCMLGSRCQGSHELYSPRSCAWQLFCIIFTPFETSWATTLSGSQMGVWIWQAMGTTIGRNCFIASPLRM